MVAVVFPYGNVAINAVDMVGGSFVLVEQIDVFQQVFGHERPFFHAGIRVNSVQVAFVGGGKHIGFHIDTGSRIAFVGHHHGLGIQHVAHVFALDCIR